MVVEIPLSKKGKKYAGMYAATVSDEDADLAELNWNVFAKPKNPVYARRRANKKIYSIHRVILERVLGRPLEKGDEVDHINGNGLDNRRENLRLATSQQNHRNRKTPKNNTSGVTGVYYYPKINRWKAGISINKKMRWFGTYVNKDDAIRARKQAEIEIFGEFAYKESAA